MALAQITGYIVENLDGSPACLYDKYWFALEKPLNAEQRKPFQAHVDHLENTGVCQLYNDNPMILNIRMDEYQAALLSKWVRKKSPKNRKGVKLSIICEPQVLMTFKTMEDAFVACPERLYYRIEYVCKHLGPADKF